MISLQNRFIVLAMALTVCLPGVAQPSREAIARYAAESGERVWRMAQRLAPDLGSRELYTYALALCESGTHLERVPELLQMGAKMQVRDPYSPYYGAMINRWRDRAVTDPNMVEFCMVGAGLVWLRHAERLSPPARAVLRETLQYGAEGCFRHEVGPGYTNMALLNALNLILLGELLGRSDTLLEGYHRLDQLCLYTFRWGIREYCSPTYYGADLQWLRLLEALPASQPVRDQARALLEVFWTSAALHWRPDNARLAGAGSRTYDYVFNRGLVETPMWAVGWLPGGPRGELEAVFSAVGDYVPPERLRTLTEQYPRLVRQRWGAEPAQAMTHFACADVSLSTSGASFGPMDVPLSVDLPGGPDRPRCYFIADGRGDPYGRERVPEGTLMKATHLEPFWAAAQRKGDAVALALYDPARTPGPVDSHFVMRRDMDEFLIAGRRADLARPEALQYAVAAHDAVVFRRGTAAVGIRVLLAVNRRGGVAPTYLVYDGNDLGVVRLTVDHGQGGAASWRGLPAALALWIRVGSGLRSKEAFETWRRDFEAAAAMVHYDGDGAHVEVAGVGGPVSVRVAGLARGTVHLSPAPATDPIELDGQAIGSRILGPLEVIRRDGAR